MSEFMNPGRLFGNGIRTRPTAPTPIEADPTDSESDDEEVTTKESADNEESEERDGADASGDTGDEGDDASDDEDSDAGEQEKDQSSGADGKDMDALPDWAKQEIADAKAAAADAEEKRRGFQSSAERANAAANAAQTAFLTRLQTGDDSKDDSILAEIAKLEDSDVIDVGTFKRFVSGLEQKQSKDTQQNQLDEVNRQVSAAVKAKGDLPDVRAAYEKLNLQDSPDHLLTNDVGRYYMGALARSEARIKTMEEEHRKELADAQKKAAQRKKSHEDKPMVPGGRRKQAVKAPKNPVLGSIFERRKARGQDPVTGEFKPPGPMTK